MTKSKFYQKIADFTNDKTDIHTFYRWFMENISTFRRSREDWEDAETDDVVSEIALYFAEYTNRHRTVEELRIIFKKFVLQNQIAQYLTAIYANGNAVDKAQLSAEIADIEEEIIAIFDGDFNKWREHQREINQHLD